MLLKNQLRDELANPLHIEKLHDIDLIGKLLRGCLMPLKAFHLLVEPLRVAEAATAELIQEGYP